MPKTIYRITHFDNFEEGDNWDFPTRAQAEQELSDIQGEVSKETRELNIDQTPIYTAGWDKHTFIKGFAYGEYPNTTQYELNKVIV